MMRLVMLRWTAVTLLVIAGLIDIPYGWYFVAGFASYLWYAMGGIYIIIAGLMAMNIRLRIVQLVALGYGLFLLSAWATGGSRDVVAYADKAIEVVLAANLVLLIRNTWPSNSRSVAMTKPGR